MALELLLLLLSCPEPSCILTDTQSALLSSEIATVLSYTCQAVKNVGWILHLQWMPSHVGQQGNYTADPLATAQGDTPRFHRQIHGFPPNHSHSDR